MVMCNGHGGPSCCSITRYLVDVRSIAPPDISIADSKFIDLPLLDTLPQELQDKATRFIRAQDKLMSLASSLLKYTFIHRHAKIPWQDVQISKSPAPHVRPYWSASPSWKAPDFQGLEFNVSHQAGLVVLAGCQTPARQQAIVEHDKGRLESCDKNSRHGKDLSTEVRLGVDIACTNEHRRSPRISTQSELVEWVDTFSEMFSGRERSHMKEDPVPATQDVQITNLHQVREREAQQKLRRFYTCWALKEAYIKMVGEGLLADWLRELEFIDVVAPVKGSRVTPSETGMKILLRGENITDTLTTELEGYEDTFLLATMMSGHKNQDPVHSPWIKLDIENDIWPCAQGICTCLAS